MIASVPRSCRPANRLAVHPDSRSASHSAAPLSCGLRTVPNGMCRMEAVVSVIQCPPWKVTAPLYTRLHAYYAYAILFLWGMLSMKPSERHLRDLQVPHAKARSGHDLACGFAQTRFENPYGAACIHIRTRLCWVLHPSKEPSPRAGYDG